MKKYKQKCNKIGLYIELQENPQIVIPMDS